MESAACRHDCCAALSLCCRRWRFKRSCASSDVATKGSHPTGQCRTRSSQRCGPCSARRLRCAHESLLGCSVWARPADTRERLVGRPGTQNTLAGTRKQCSCGLRSRGAVLRFFLPQNKRFVWLPGHKKSCQASASLTAQAAPHVQHLLIWLQVEQPAHILQAAGCSPCQGLLPLARAAARDLPGPGALRRPGGPETRARGAGTGAPGEKPRCTWRTAGAAVAPCISVLQRNAASWADRRGKLEERGLALCVSRPPGDTKPSPNTRS